MNATANASLRELFNPAGVESKFQHQRRFVLMEPAIVLPDLLQNLHYSFFIFV